MKQRSQTDWRVVEEANGVVFRWGYSGEDLVAEWRDILTLRATRSGELKTVRPAEGAPGDLVEKTRFGVAAAFLRARRRQHALHASAVAWQGKALVCVGASGLGKSTMAERMCRLPGVRLLADDTAAIELAVGGGVRVPPSESAVWLAEKRSNVKAPVRSSQLAETPAVLSCIVALAFDATRSVELRDLRGGDAVAALLPSVVRFERTSALWERELDFLGELVSQSRIVRATRSRDVAPEAVADALLGLLTGEAP